MSGEQTERWMIRVRWHTYDQAPSRGEWLELPSELNHASVSRRADWIGSHLREREGLPPDSHESGERVLWFEWDLIRPAAVVEGPQIPDRR